VLGFLAVSIIVALRLDPAHLLEVSKTVAPPLAIIIGALFGTSKRKDDKDQ